MRHLFKIFSHCVSVKFDNIYKTKMEYNFLLVKTIITLLLVGSTFGEYTNVISSINQTAPDINHEIAFNYSHRYVVYLHFSLNPNRLLPFLRDLTYYHHDVYNITTGDLIDLSNIKNLNLNNSLEILRKLNISENLINIANFRRLIEVSNMSFNDFFEKLKNTTNLTGQPLQSALQILNISTAEFSSAVTFGDQNAVYDVLTKGQYDDGKLHEAANVLGTDLETFYSNVKTIILDQMGKNTLSYYAENLKEIPEFGKKLYDDLWDALRVNISDIHRVGTYRNIVDNFYDRLNENVTIGIVTGDQEITVNKQIPDKLRALKDIIDIQAGSISQPLDVFENLVWKSKEGNFATLWSNETMPSYIKIGKKSVNDDHMPNCTYITADEIQVKENEVEIINISRTSILGKVANGTVFNLGNPLICDEELYGLASSESIDQVTFDTVYQVYQEIANISVESTTFRSGSVSYNMNVSTLILCVLYFVFLLNYFC